MVDGVRRERLPDILHLHHDAETEIYIMKITKDTKIGEAIAIDAGIIPILMSAGMHCVGCPSSAGESLEEACMVHGMNCDDLLEDINTYLESVG